jgi:hypothetical protein
MSEATTTHSTDRQELSILAINLLKKVLYRDDDGALWQALLDQQAQLRDYFAVLDLELILDEAEGHAFLRARPDHPEASGSKLPRLIARRPLSFPVSLLLALLRRKLAEFDAGSDQTRLILSRSDIADLLRVFLPENSNEARLIDQIDAHIKIVGFLRNSRAIPRSTATKRPISRSDASSKLLSMRSGWRSLMNGWRGTRRPWRKRQRPDRMQSLQSPHPGASWPAIW